MVAVLLREENEYLDLFDFDEDLYVNLPKNMSDEKC